jgi:hypothetical protein
VILGRTPTTKGRVVDSETRKKLKQAARRTPSDVVLHASNLERIISQEQRLRRNRRAEVAERHHLEESRAQA